jgi:hypothetical protein
MAKKVISVLILNNGEITVSSDFDNRWFRDLVGEFEKKVLERLKEKLK